MALELMLDYRMRLMDFDRYGRVQPWALLDMFQDAATAHANQLHIGRDDMVPQGVFWAVIRTKYEAVRAPEYHQAVKVRTWPHSLSRFSFIRDFNLLDDAGNLLVKASSEWVLMDVATRKFASVKDYYAGPTDFAEDRAFPKKPRKVSGFEEGNRPVQMVVPSYCDIDVNGHVNNAMYARFIANAVASDLAGPIESFQIDYRQEVAPGVPLSVHALVEDGRILVKGLRDDGEISFASAIGLKLE